MPASRSAGKLDDSSTTGLWFASLSRPTWKTGAPGSTSSPRATSADAGSSSACSSTALAVRPSRGACLLGETAEVGQIAVDGRLGHERTAAASDGAANQPAALRDPTTPGAT